MPLNGRIQALFGRVDRLLPRHGYLQGAESTSAHRATKAIKAADVKRAGRLAPPDLVIQDELHLISGPLGTLVGLYEVAVQACARARSTGARSGRRWLGITSSQVFCLKGWPSFSSSRVYL